VPVDNHTNRLALVPSFGHRHHAHLLALHLLGLAGALAAPQPTKRFSEKLLETPTNLSPHRFAALAHGFTAQSDFTLRLILFLLHLGLHVQFFLPFPDLFLSFFANTPRLFERFVVLVDLKQLLGFRLVHADLAQNLLEAVLQLLLRHAVDHLLDLHMLV